MVKINGKEKVNVAIMTSYLTDDFEAQYAERKAKCEGCKDCTCNKLSEFFDSVDDIAKRVDYQKEKYGYDPNNFKGTRYLETPNFIVMLETPEEHEIESPALADFAIAGSTMSKEEMVMAAKGTGLVIARYSVFYGRESDYSGNTADRGGYSLDLPKKVATAKALITHEPFLEGILERDEVKIMDSIGSLNQALEQPVIVTPYLATALLCVPKELRDMIVGRRSL